MKIKSIPDKDLRAFINRDLRSFLEDSPVEYRLNYLVDQIQFWISHLIKYDTAQTRRLLCHHYGKYFPELYEHQ